MNTIFYGFVDSHLRRGGPRDRRRLSMVERAACRARRIESRIRSMSAGGNVQQERLSILKKRMLDESKPFDRLLLRMPRVHRLDLVIQQSGLDWTLPKLIMLSTVFAAFAWLALSFATLPQLAARRSRCSPDACR